MRLVSCKDRVPGEGELDGAAGPDQKEVSIADLSKKYGVTDHKRGQKRRPIPGEDLLCRPMCMRSPGGGKYLPLGVLPDQFPPAPGGKPGKIGLETGAELLAGSISLCIGAVERDQLPEGCLHGKGRSGPAQIVTGIAMAVCNGKRNAGLCPG